MTAPKQLLLTLDIGTSSTRALLFDHKAHAIPHCIAQIDNRLETTVDGGATFAAESLFENCVFAIDHLLKEAGPLAEQIGGVAVASFVSNVLGVSESGEPVTPVYTYADTRNAADAETLRTELGTSELADAHDRTGCLLHTSYLPARFRWLERLHPEQLQAARYWLSIGEYLLWRFLGQRAASYSVASWSGLLDRRTLNWDTNWLTQLPINVEQLSPLVDVSQPLVGLQGRWAERWPTLSQVPWFPAVGDGAAANVGSSCGTLNARQRQRLALTIGSTGAMRVVLNAKEAANRPVPDGLWFYRVDAMRGLLGGATTEGGNLYGWLRNTLRLPDEAAIERALQNREPTTHGLTVLPFVAGERAPGWDDDARASLVGFTLNTEPLDILQASQEGIAYRFSIIYERIISALATVDQGDGTSVDRQIIGSGGALLSSPVWLQMIADTLGQPVTALDEDEITARGLALLGLEQLGVIHDINELQPRMGKTYVPDRTRHRYYQAALEKQIYYYDRIQQKQR